MQVIMIISYVKECKNSAVVQTQSELEVLKHINQLGTYSLEVWLYLKDTMEVRQARSPSHKQMAPRLKY